MSPPASLIAASAAFVGSHFLLSHPLRAPLVARMGERPFQGLYSMVALASFAWMVVAARALPAEAPLWVTPDWVWLAGAVVMLFASVLLAGSFAGNPALPAPGAAAAAAQPPRGVFAITRHPMMWSFALWGLVHIAVWPTRAVIVVAAAIVVLALGGAAGQDAKKARLMGADWQSWIRRTAFTPFAGPSPAAAMWPGWGIVAIGVAIWLAATWAHLPLGGMAVGVWRSL